MRSSLRTIAILLVSAISQTAIAVDRPNLLWLTSEDNSPYLGCYGDPFAKTPHLDALAASGVRYRLAFSSAPVCSTARTTLLMGVNGSTLGLQHHRSSVAVPAKFVPFPQLLREAGYYCTNNVKTDYNLSLNDRRSPSSMWDASSQRAHYRHRPAGQPFFAVFNSTTTHESQTSDAAYAKKPQTVQDRIVPPATVKLPPYHPDTPVIRENWSRYYEQLHQMDSEIGLRLKELDDSGLASDTIVFYFSDHGGSLPRGKRNIHDSGTRVPLIIRFPEKWAHLAPAQPGEWVDDPVAFVDFAATILSLADVSPPEWLEGQSFLGPEKPAVREEVFLFRGRMDERNDFVRAIRTKSFLYVKNFAPHRPYGQHYSYPFEVMPSMQSWFDEYQAGRCNAVQRVYWEPKPAEEFYTTQNDPDQITNRINDSDWQAEITQLRQQLRQHLEQVPDTGFVPEGLAARETSHQTWYELVRRSDYPNSEIVDLAWKASSGNPADRNEFQRLSRHAHPVMRYWAATGLLMLNADAQPAGDDLHHLLNDPCFEVQAVAAEALGQLGQASQAIPALTRIARDGNPSEILAALTVLERFVETGWTPPEAALKAAHSKPTEPASRVYQRLQNFTRKQAH